MNKAFVTLLWLASALLAYWFGLEQGSESVRVSAVSPVVSSAPQISRPLKQTTNSVSSISKTKISSAAGLNDFSGEEDNIDYDAITSSKRSEIKLAFDTQNRLIDKATEDLYKYDV